MPKTNHFILNIHCNINKLKFNLKNKMKNKIAIYLFLVLIVLKISVTTINAQTCATVQRFETTTFARLTSGTGGAVPVATHNQNGWQGSGLGDINVGTTSVYVSDNTNTQTFTNAVTNGNLKGTGATFTMTFTALNGNSLNFPYDGNQSDLRVSYGGVLYATVSTSNGTATVGAGTVSFSNGAVDAVTNSNSAYSINMNANGGAAVIHTVSIKLPVTIPNSGNFLVTFIPNANAIDPHTFSDDFNIFTASLLSCPINYSGTILNDANGLTDNLVNGTAVNTTTVSGLQVALYDALGNIVPGTTTNVNTDGTYNIAYSETGTFTVRLLNKPSTYVNTGESSNGTGSTPDGTADGIVSSYTILDAITNTDKPNGNIGIQRAPETAISSLPSQPNPGGSNVITIPSTAFTTSTGINPNTGDEAPGVISFIKITTFPANTTSIVINGIPYASLTAINTAYPNGIPTDVTGAPTMAIGINPIDGAVTVILQIAAVDNAGTLDPTPGSITIPFTIPLPVTLLSFNTIVRGECTIKLQWEVGEEDKFSHYEIEASNDGVNFGYIDKVIAAGSDTKYSYEYKNGKVGKNLFRLKMISHDNSSEYSPISIVNLNCEANRNIKVYPTASNNNVTLEGIRKGERLLVVDALGRQILLQIADSEKILLNISSFVQGNYNITVLTENNQIVNLRVVKL